MTSEKWLTCQLFLYILQGIRASSWPYFKEYTSLSGHSPWTLDFTFIMLEVSKFKREQTSYQSLYFTDIQAVW